MRIKCDTCSYSAVSKLRVEKHERQFHSADKPYACTFSQCAYRTKYKQRLHTHEQTHETDLLLKNPFTCKFNDCEYRTSSEKGMESHVWAKHNPGREKNILCPLCPSVFYNAAQRRGHIRNVHTGERPFKCNQCNYAAKTAGYLSTHVKTVHEKLVQHKCTFPNCNYSTSHGPKTLNAHIKTHNPHSSFRRPLECSFPGCGYKARFPNRLERHKECRHNPNRRKEFSCSLCPEAFFSRKGLEIHINSAHIKETTYACIVCKFETHDCGKFQNHRDKCFADGENVLECDLCEFRTRQKNKLRRHRANVHCVGKRFKCTHPACHHETDNPRAYKRHILTHETSIEKQWRFPCRFPGCDYRRKIKGQLMQHEQLHQVSSMQLQCESCPHRSFPDIETRRFHNLISHSKPPFKCSRCDYSGSKRKYLFSHIRYQHKGQRYNRRKLSSRKAESGNMTFHRIPVILLKRFAVVWL